MASTTGLQQSQLCIVFSSAPLTAIYNAVAEAVGNDDSVGYARIVFDRNGKETNRTLVLVSANTWRQLENAGLADEGESIRFAPYKILEGNLPKETQSDSLCLLVPESFQKQPVFAEVDKIIAEKLEHLALWGILPSNSWKVSVTLTSREKGEVGKRCFISFDDTVSLEQRAIVRLLLNDTYWASEDDSVNEELAGKVDIDLDSPPILKCFWAFPQKKRTPRPDKDDKSPEAEAARKEAEAARDKLRKEKKRKFLGATKPVTAARQEADKRKYK